jgi:hypothetical protein
MGSTLRSMPRGSTQVIGDHSGQTSQVWARTDEVGQAKLPNAQPLCRRVAATGNPAS